MARVHLVATAGAGGDLQPLLAAAVALRRRGHEFTVLGDRGVERAVADLDAHVELLPSEYSLGPALVAAVQDAMREAGGEASKAGPIVMRKMSEWAESVGSLLADSVQAAKPDVVLTSLFGVEALLAAAPACPWVVVNSTFYMGPDPPRPLEEDVALRAVPLLARYSSLLEAPDLVLHATDQVFDFDFDGLPPKHQYVGPLGIWEPDLPVPGYLDEPGPPWGLVTISTQLQDDDPLLETVLDAVGGKDLRVVATVGNDRNPEEMASPPANVRLEQTVSHAAVLDRAALLVSHAGHGAVLKALWHGVPMVLVPWGRDQPGVAARAEALGAAVVVEREGADAEAISRAIDRCLADDRMYAAAAEQRRRLAGTQPPEVAADHIEALVP